MLQAAVEADVKIMSQEAQPGVPYDVTVASRERAASDKRRCDIIINFKRFLEEQLDDSGEAVA